MPTSVIFLIILLILGLTYWVEGEQRSSSKQLFSHRNFPRSHSSRFGDINIGGLFELYRPPTNVNVICSKSYDKYLMTESFAMIFALESYNKRFERMYNLSLGYYILPTCTNPAAAQIQAIKLNHVMRNQSMVAVIGPFTSLETRLVSPFFSYHRIPHLSPSANSVIFEERSWMFQYLFRFLSDQSYYINAISVLMRQFEWNLMAVIFSDDIYNNYFAAQMRLRATRMNACIVLDIRFPSLFNVTTLYNGTLLRQLSMLLSHKGPLATVLFLNKYQIVLVLKLLKVMLRSKKNINLIFIALDTWPSTEELAAEGLIDLTLGAITIYEFSHNPIHFNRWRKNKVKDDIWLYYWQGDNSTRYDASNKLRNQNGLKVNIKDLAAMNDLLNYDSKVSIVIDTVTAIVIALGELLEKNCRKELQANESITFNERKRSILKCISHHNLYPYLRNISFIGRTGLIKFNNKQVVRHDLRIGNLINISGTIRIPGVGLYNAADDSLKILEPIRWNHFLFTNSSTAPGSRCSKPCGRREFVIPTQLRCCWACGRCPMGKIHTGVLALPCEQCPAHTMPDDVNGIHCVPMSRNYICENRVFTHIIYVLAGFGLLCVLVLGTYYINFYNGSIFKMEIRSVLHSTFIGVIMGLISLTLLISFPRPAICATGQFLLLLSFVLIYSSLMGKLILVKSKLNASRKVNHLLSIDRRVGYIIIGFSLCQLILNIMIITFERGRPFTVERELTMESNKLDTYCPIFSSSTSFRAITIAYQLIILYLSFYNAYKLENVAQGFSEAIFLKNNTYLIIILYLCGSLAHIFSRTFTGLKCYLTFYLIILYATICANSLYKIKAHIRAKDPNSSQNRMSVQAPN